MISRWQVNPPCGQVFPTIWANSSFWPTFLRCSAMVLGRNILSDLNRWCFWASPYYYQIDACIWYFLCQSSTNCQLLQTSHFYNFCDFCETHLGIHGVLSVVRNFKLFKWVFVVQLGFVKCQVWFARGVGVWVGGCCWVGSLESRVP